ncbi:conserved Plasmodium protein, unknown function [Plasmodium ovale]|nr:conserved Plasmodium protein, unknown function [Plasmodium ovale]
MVKIGKKLKGFNEGINKLDTQKGKQIEKKEEEDEEEVGKNEIENKTKDIVENEENSDVYFIEESTRKKENSQDLNFYVQKSNASILLELLLYKVLMNKPKNIVNFVQNELNILFKHKMEKGFESHPFGSEYNDVGLCSNREKDENSFCPNANQYITQPIPMELIKDELFLGEHLLSLENVIDAVKFIKIENSDKVYFSNLLKILQHFENAQNKNILIRENIQPKDNIPLTKAIHLTTLFYNNYFGNTSIN